ncbi:uncharacterized protein LOC144580020 isoform X2 [Callithrix jacchus]
MLCSCYCRRGKDPRECKVETSLKVGFWQEERKGCNTKGRFKVLKGRSKCSIVAGRESAEAEHLEEVTPNFCKQICLQSSGTPTPTFNISISREEENINIPKEWRCFYGKPRNFSP